MATNYRVLLVESDDYSITMLQKFIHMHFPHVDVDPVTPAASDEQLERNSYDIIVCDAYLRHDERIAFVGKLCRKGGTFLIIITGDSDIKPDTFSPHLTKYIHDILYKPIDLKALSRSLLCSMRRVDARRAETKGPE